MGIINDLLTGKQSSQCLEHDLPAIMLSPARPGPTPTLWKLRSSLAPSPYHSNLQGPKACR